MTVNENSHTGIVHLVKFDWPSADYYYLCGLGFVSYDGQTWYGHTDTQGQVLSLSGFTEQKEQLPNRDCEIALTSTVEGYIIAGDWTQCNVTIHEANRDPATGILTVLDSSNWEIGGFEVEGARERKVSFSLKSVLARLIEKQQAWTYSPESQAVFSAATDYGFDYSANKGASSVGGVVSGGGGNSGYGGYFAIQ